MDYYEIITRLIGPIKPVGETNEDERRAISLSEMLGLVDSLIEEIADITPYKDRPEHSMSKAGQRAYDYLMNLKESIDL